MSSAPTGRILCQLKSDTGDNLGAPIDLPLSVDKSGLEKICHALLSSEQPDDYDEDVPYAFFIDNEEFRTNLAETISASQTDGKQSSVEKVTEIIYQPQALFKVRAVTRCTSTMEGHTEAICSVAFSPDGK